MSIVYERGGVAIHHGNCLEVLATLAENSVHCCVTSPPYWGLRSYGVPPTVWGGDPACEHVWGAMERGKRKDILPEDQTTLHSRVGVDERQDGAATNGGRFCEKCSAWLGCFGNEPMPELYIENLTAIFREVRRVLHPSGVLWLNLGDSYANDGKWGGETGGKQAHLPDDNRKRVGRDKRFTGLKPKDLIGIPWLAAFALRADGWYLRSALPWVKRNAMPDSTSDRPGNSLEYVFLLSKSERYYFDMEAVRRAPSGISGGAKFGKVSLDGPGSRECTAADRERYATQGRQWRNSDLWFESADSPHGLCGVGDELVGLDVNLRAFSEAHFAVFPPAVVSPLIRSGTSEKGVCGQCGSPWKRLLKKTDSPLASCNGSRFDVGKTARKHEHAPQQGERFETVPVGWAATCECDGEVAPSVVLEPFLGSGTTAEVCRNLGRKCVGIELNREYIRMAEKRLKQDVLPLTG